MQSSLKKLLNVGKRLYEIPKNRLLNFIDPPANVLLYHRVTDLPSDPLALAVSPAHFREQILFLKERFHVRRFEEPWFPGPSALVSFDDGYADNVLEALPILEEVGVPAIFFISTGTIGSDREYWWDDLERLILLPEKLPERFLLDDPEFAAFWPTKEAEQRRTFYQEMQALMKRIGFSRREEWLAQLREWSGLGAAGRPTHRPMSLQELKHLASSPWVTIGAHTITHTRLSNLTSEEQEREIIGSRNQLEAWLGETVPFFSYPFGDREDYGPQTVEICRRHFAKTASTLWRQAHSWNENQQLPRLFVGDWPGQSLARKCMR